MQFLRSAAAACALAVAACAPSGAPPGNLLVLSVDTLRRSALRAFDPAAPAHPALDAFARESAVFTNAFSTASWTLPAHASLLTGLYPDRHGATDRRVALAAEVPTLAELLSARGYQTEAFTGGGFLDPAYGLSRGFGVYDDGEIPGGGPFDRALRWLERRPDGAAPFLLFLHTHAVHDYLDAREGAVGALAAERQRLRERNRTCATGRQSCRAPAWREMRALYRAEVDRLDRSFGQLLDALERRQLLDSTLVVVTSDHGEGFEPERRRIHHGGRLHEDQIRIPLLVRAGGAPPRRVEDPVSLVDLAPTLLEWAGAPAGDFDGRSFAPLLRGGAAPAARPLYAMEHAVVWRWPGGRGGLEAIQPLPVAIAVLRGPHWYIRSRGPEGAGEELYDMAADPEQRSDLAAEAPPGLEALRALAAQRVRERPATPVVAQDGALGEELRALGYAD